METLETSVKYLFDKEMVQFVKHLEIKTAMFGYDKTDVYKKFKDLLVRARSFCDDAVEKERAKIIDLELQLKELKEAMSMKDQKITHVSSFEEDGAMDEKDDAMEETAAGVASGGSAVAVAAMSTALQEKIDAPSLEPCVEDRQKHERAQEEEKSNVLHQTQNDVARFKERYLAIQEQHVALEDENKTLLSKLDQQSLVFEEMKRTLSDAKEEQELLKEQLSAITQEKEALKEKLETYAEKEEALNYTEAILDEARLEGENIVREARVRAEQELFLYRARHRDEERAHEERVASLKEEKKSLEQECLSYRSYIGQGQNLMHEIKAYVERFDLGDFEGGAPNDALVENEPFKACEDTLAQDQLDAIVLDDQEETTSDDEW